MGVLCHFASLPGHADSASLKLELYWQLANPSYPLVSALHNTGVNRHTHVGQPGFFFFNVIHEHV